MAMHIAVLLLLIGLGPLLYSFVSRPSQQGPQSAVPSPTTTPSPMTQSRT